MTVGRVAMGWRVVAVYFLGLLVVGLVVFRDYGVPWDEPRQRLVGGVSARFVLQTVAPSWPLPAGLPDKALADFDDRDYGVAFEMPAVAAELLLGLTDSRDIYLLRHLLTYLVFLGGVFAVYRMATRRFDDRRLGLCAATMLVLSPRFFAEAFYNSKDIVFMACFAVATNTMLAFVTRPRMSTALAHATATAVAIDVRVAAILFVPMTLALCLVDGLKRRNGPARLAALTAVFLGSAAVLVVLLFPWLWEDPVGRFLDVVRNMSAFQRFSDRVRYMGGSIMPDDLPWHYLPVWIAISTPLLYLVLSVIGGAATLRTLASRHIRLWADPGEMQDLVFLGLLVLPVGLVMSTESVVYDGWRHLYVYPSLVLLATRGLVVAASLARSVRFGREAVALLVAACLSSTVIWMVRAHPMQNVYFNGLAGHDWRRSYEVDYWGLGNRIALEHLLAHDRNQTVAVRAESSTALEHALLLLPPPDRRRVRVVGKDEPARYVLTNYRGVDVDTADDQSNRRLFYQLVVDGEVILSVYETLES
jgi:hypothetical protein